MGKFDRKDAVGMAWGMCMIAIVPVMVLAARPRPFSARSAPQLIQIVREDTQEEAFGIMSARYNRWSPNENPDVRWQQIEETMLASGAEVPEASAAIATAKTGLAQAGWPLFAKRSYLAGHRVWLVASSSPTAPLGYACNLVSSEEKRRAEMDRMTHNMKVVVVDAEAPYQLLSN